jgi:hypothetical protein
MNKKTLLISSLFLAFSVNAWAGILNSTIGSNLIDDVKLSTAAVSHVVDREVNLQVLGAGLRFKTVPFLGKKNVYVGELFSSDAAIFIRTDADALSSMSKMQTVAMKMTFRRDVESARLYKGFVEGFTANKVDMKSAPIKAFLDAIQNGGGAVTEKTLTFVGETLADGSEVITYENSNTPTQAKSIVGATGFVNQVMSLWMGIPADDGVAALKKDIIGTVK